MTGLIEAELTVVQTGAGQHADGACNHARLVGKNVSEHVLRENNVKLSRILHQLHGTVVHQHMLQFHLRIVRRNLFHNLPPESGGIQHICLIHAGYFLPALHCDAEPLHRNAADLVLVIGQGVHGLPHAVFHHGPALSEIQAARKLTHDHHIETGPADLLLQRTCPRQFIIKHSRTQVGEQIQGLSDSQKPRFGTQIGGQFIPWRCGSVSSDGAHQHRVRRLSLGHGLLGQRNTVYINGCPAHQNVLKNHVMAVDLSHLFQHLLGLPDDLRPDAVAGNASNM